MVDRWDEGYPQDPVIVAMAPDRQDIAISFAHKAALLAAIIIGIIGLWAMTSRPVSTGSADGGATLEAPIVAPPGISTVNTEPTP